MAPVRREDRFREVLQDMKLDGRRRAFIEFERTRGFWKTTRSPSSRSTARRWPEGWIIRTPFHTQPQMESRVGALAGIASELRLPDDKRAA